ncbi:MAG: adenosylcobinamide-phosphate synthase CbiB [Elainellaceae cyanobacterium]
MVDGMTGVVLAIAALLDFWIGDPWNWLHPVQVMGWVIARYSRVALKSLNSALLQRIAGIGLGLLLIFGSGICGWLLVTLGFKVHPWMGGAIASILLASCLAARSLRRAADEVIEPLEQNDLAEARSRLSLYVGRDTDDLNRDAILRAVFETVTENAVDGIMAPLFYALIGAVLGHVATGGSPSSISLSVALALGFKASSTLDSMVGYRTAPYTHLGWFSARTDDVLTWLPCRLTVLTIGLLSKQPLHVWRICRRDAPQDPSPNAGWSECVYAAALGVQVGGINVYRGVVKHKPKLGDADEPLAIAKVYAALNLTRWTMLLWLTLGIILWASLAVI